MVTQMLESAGYETLQAEDGIEGLEVLEGSAPDLVITDIKCQGLTGSGSSSEFATAIATEPSPSLRQRPKTNLRSANAPAKPAPRLDRQACRSGQTCRRCGTVERLSFRRPLANLILTQPLSGDGSRRAGGYHAILAGLSAQCQASTLVAELPTTRCFSRGGKAYL